MICSIAVYFFSFFYYGINRFFVGQIGWVYPIVLLAYMLPLNVTVIVNLPSRETNNLFMFVVNRKNHSSIHVSRTS